jgi:acetyl esterase/lipase
VYHSLGIDAKSVILVGDSAGGNLALGLTLRALHTNVRIPDGIILGYPGTHIPSPPALNLSLKTFAPSMLVSIDDCLLRFNFLIACLNSYITDGDPSSDPYLSPILIKDEVGQ